MKICIVTSEYPQKTVACGGIGTYQQHLAREWALGGHEIHVLVSMATQNADTLEDGIHYHERIPSIPSWMKSSFAAFWLPVRFLCSILQTDSTLQKLQEQYHFDLIQTTNYLTPCFLYQLRKKRPEIVTWVNTLADTVAASKDKNTWFKKNLPVLFEKWTIPSSDFIVTNSLSHREQIVKKFSISEKEIKIISLGIPMPRNLSKVEKPAETLKILYVGRLESRKGTDVLLVAIPKVLALSSHAIFILAGKDYSESYEKNFFLKNESLRGKVLFKGEISQGELESLYEYCDIFVSPSRYESFGLTFVEAMSYEKPVIGCRAGAIPEVVEEGFTGLLVEPEDSEGLAKSILKLIQNEALRLAMGKNGGRISRERFSAEAMAKNAMAYYESLVAKPLEAQTV